MRAHREGQLQLDCPVTHRLVDCDPDHLRVEHPAARAVWARGLRRENAVLRALIYGWVVPVDGIWVPPLRGGV